MSSTYDSDKDVFLDLYSHIRSPMVICRGEGAYVWDSKGKRYLDFVSGGRAVNALGHCHPKVVEAIRRQADILIHVANDFYSQPQLDLARRLHDLTGGRVFFCNSGAEANEAAIKLARKYGKQVGGGAKYEIISAENSFHGRTYAALTATGQPKYQRDYEPLVPGFKYVPFNDLDALKKAVSENTCAVMLEPILGESGVYPATKSYLQLARKLCNEFSVALILDEVQTGLGRTGNMFAFEYYGIRPDIMTLSKALGGGVPIGATVAWEPVASTFKPGDHATTFGGSPLVAAAALASINALHDEGLVENARIVGSYLSEKLKDLPLVSEVRGRGMMVGVELSSAKAGRVKQMCRDNGLLIATVGELTLRLLPPLILSEAQADAGVQIIAKVLDEVSINK